MADSSPSLVDQGAKQTSLVSLSTQTSTELKPWSTGRQVEKSSDQQAKHAEGIGRGANSPGGATVESLGC